MTKEAMSDAAFDQLLARINMVSTFKLTVIFMLKVKQTLSFSDDSHPGQGVDLAGRWNRGWNIPISRFQKDNIPIIHLNIQYSNFKMQLLPGKPVSDFSESNIQISPFQWVIFNIQISKCQYSLLFVTGVSKLDLAVAQVTVAVAPCVARCTAPFNTKNEKIAPPG